MLTGQVQGGPARDEHAQTRGGSHPTRHRGSAVHEVLEVVEHKEQLPFGEIAADDVPHRPVGLFADGQDLGDRVCDRSSSWTGASETNHAPSANEPSARCATSTASRVFPLPGGPVSVIKRSDVSSAQEPLDLRLATDEPRRHIRKRMRDLG